MGLLDLASAASAWRGYEYYKAGSFGNPLIAGFNDFCHIVIGQYFGRLIMSMADNFRSNTRHKLLPVITRPNLIFQFRSEWSKQNFA